MILSMQIAKGRDYIPGGFVDERRCREDWAPFPVGDIDISSRQVRFLERILELLESRSIPAVLVVQPVPEITRDSMLNVEEVDQLLRSIAREYSTPFLDFNTSMSLRPEHFCDSHHLSPLGVAEFSSRVLQELESLGYLQSNPGSETEPLQRAGGG